MTQLDEIKRAMGYEARPILEVCGTCRDSKTSPAGKLWCFSPKAERPFRVSVMGWCENHREGE